MTKEEYFKFFEATTKQMLDICKKKNADYTGTDASPFSNFERVETLGICTTEQGFLTRITDKLCRVSSFCAKGELQVKDESVTDTLQDMANYCILMMGYLKSKRPETDPASSAQLPLPFTTGYVESVGSAGVAAWSRAADSLKRILESEKSEQSQPVSTVDLKLNPPTNPDYSTTTIIHNLEYPSSPGEPGSITHQCINYDPQGSIKWV